MADKKTAGRDFGMISSKFDAVQRNQPVSVLQAPYIRLAAFSNPTLPAADSSFLPVLCGFSDRIWTEILENEKKSYKPFTSWKVNAEKIIVTAPKPHDFDPNEAYRPVNFSRSTFTHWELRAGHRPAQDPQLLRPDRQCTGLSAFAL